MNRFYSELCFIRIHIIISLIVENKKKCFKQNIQRNIKYCTRFGVILLFYRDMKITLTFFKLDDIFLDPLIEVYKKKKGNNLCVARNYWFKKYFNLNSIK